MGGGLREDSITERRTVVSSGVPAYSYDPIEATELQEDCSGSRTNAQTLIYKTVSIQ